jgi:hypothetical protein
MIHKACNLKWNYLPFFAVSVLWLHVVHYFFIYTLCYCVAVAWTFNTKFNHTRGTRRSKRVEWEKERKIPIRKNSIILTIIVMGRASSQNHHHSPPSSSYSISFVLHGVPAHESLLNSYQFFVFLFSIFFFIKITLRSTFSALKIK